jgi:hypothetical protein
MGCKAYVLVPKADRRKDWQDKSMIGIFIGLSTSKVGYRILIGDTVVTSIHVLFDEKIPSREKDYYKEFDEKVVNFDPVERSVAEFTYLVGEHHMNSGLLASERSF